MASPRRCENRLSTNMTALLLVLFVGVVAAFYNSFTSPHRELRREVALIRQAGEPMDWQRLVEEPIPDNENAAIVYRRVFERMEEPNQEEQRALWGFLSSGEDRSTQVAAVQRLVERNRGALNLLYEALARNRLRFTEDWSEPRVAFRHYAPLRQLARLLAAQALLRREDGDIQEAGEACIRGLRLARQMEAEEPASFLGLLVRAALQEEILRAAQDALRDTQADSQVFRPLLDELQRHRVRDHLQRALIAERCWLWESSPLPSAGPLGNPLIRHRLTRDIAFVLGTLRRSEQLAAEPLYDWEAIQALDDQLEQRWQGEDGPTCSALRVPWSLLAGMEAGLRIARLALALRLYRHDHGDYPDSLDILAPAYLAEIPLDPFSNRPFIYRREEGGFIVYSVAMNGYDEGGEQDRWAGTDDIAWRSGI